MAIWAALTLALAGVASRVPRRPTLAAVALRILHLTPPQVVQVDGVSKVTATITSVVCGVAASPYKSVACVELAGQQGGSCMQGTDTAQALLRALHTRRDLHLPRTRLRHHRPDAARGQLPDPRAHHRDPVGDH